MADPHTVATIRAALEALLPAVDGRAGAVDVGGDEHAIDQLDLTLSGYPDMVATLLDAYAAELKPGASFVGLSLRERLQALRALASDESQDIRDALDGLAVFGIGGAYSEWPARHDEPPVPRTWADTRYPGPSDGYPEYRSGV